MMDVAVLGGLDEGYSSLLDVNDCLLLPWDLGLMSWAAASWVVVSQLPCAVNFCCHLLLMASFPGSSRNLACAMILTWSADSAFPALGHRQLSPLATSA